MVSRVSLKGLYGRVRLQGLSWGDQIRRSRQSRGTVDSVPPHLMVHVPPVQHRSGMNDCATFAIAFAVFGSLTKAKYEATSP